MLTITLGTQASGSTWLFNVVRALFEVTGVPVFSSSAEEGIDALDKMPLNVRNVVLKSHSMDQRLLRIAQLAGAKLVISTRDPRDSVVSQGDRFGATVRTAALEISRSLATIESLPADLPVLRFRYEDRFMERPESVAEIARFLGVGVDEAAIYRIFDDLTPDNVRTKITLMLEALPTGVVPSHDPVTHWHPAHVGDGRTGKWRDRLDAASQEIVSGCLNALASTGLRRGDPMRWSAELFTCNIGIPDEPKVELACDGGADYLAYGPYLHIPRGRWRASADLQVSSLDMLELEGDIFLPWDYRRLAHGFVTTAVGDVTELTLDFEHHDHFQPLEARLSSVEGSRGTVTFSGWRLYFLGPLE